MKVVIIGASDNPDRYSYKAANALLNKGFSIQLVGTKNKTVLGHPIEKEVKFHDEPVVITLYIGPQHQNNYFQKIIETNPIKVIFNPGTENADFQKLLDESNISWEEACTLVKIKSEPISMITIRKATTKDCETILNWENDPSLWSVTDDPGPFTREDIFDFLKENNSLPDKNQERWLIEHNQQAIGMIDLFDWNKINHSIGVGIALPEKKNRRKGYGYIALNILEKAMIMNYGVKQIHCIIHQDNPASKRLFEKLEFTFDRQEIHREKVVYKYSKNLEL